MKGSAVAEPLAESPGESWLRLRLIDAGFGRPTAQIVVKGSSRDFRIDLGYPTPMDDGRRQRLARLGFDAVRAEALSALHTRNFM